MQLRARPYLFDRTTGNVDPQVIADWRTHYDLAHSVESTWVRRGPYFKGKIHINVGTADTFYLDAAAHKLDAVLKTLGADAQSRNSYNEGSSTSRTAALRSLRTACRTSSSAPSSSSGRTTFRPNAPPAAAAIPT